MRFLRPLAGFLATALGIASFATPAVAAGSNLFAQDTAIQAGSVPITTDAVTNSIHRFWVNRRRRLPSPALRPPPPMRAAGQLVWPLAAAS
jgi:hypothetical protein